MGRLILLMMLSLSSCANAITLVSNGRSDYKIIIPAHASATEQHAANVLQSYLKQISGAFLPIVNDASPTGGREILIGRTNRLEANKYPELVNEGVCIATHGETLMLYGPGKGTLYAVYTFLEQYLGCRKYTASLKIIPAQQTITVSEINYKYSPKNAFRSVYYPDPQLDQEYLDWHKLHRIDEQWGLWGHSFDKLLPAKDYFDSHPEYFALTAGKRRPAQLCMSNAEGLDIVCNNLKTKIADNPTARYWSVSQNDDNGYCECPACSALIKRYGSPAGALLHFVNQVAARFPQQQFTTLAYGWSGKPPTGIAPAKNLTIIFSTISMNRSRAVAGDARSVNLRADYENWTKLTRKVIVWDYVTQFTNYISPFPDFKVLKPNLTYFMRQLPEGFFMQGSENLPSEFSELKTYVLSKLLWNETQDAEQLRDEFMNAYYGKAAPAIRNYLHEIEKQVAASGGRLDIYDNPVKPYKTYLSPDKMNNYGRMLRDALQAVKSEPELYHRTESAVLPLNFAVLQQARFYGLEPNGIFKKTGDSFIINAGFETQVDEFVSASRNLGITQLNEDGWTLDEYAREWKALLKKGPALHLALNKPVKLLTTPDDDLVSKGARTLTDGNEGNPDFQYNWLAWYGNDMSVEIDLEQSMMIKKVSLAFLENQRHNMFLPTQLILAVSTDGIMFKTIDTINVPAPEENYKAAIEHFSFNLAAQQVRYIRVTATQLKALPDWKYDKNSKPMLLCDEIVVE